MAKCYFNNIESDGYQCEYEVSKHEIIVMVENPVEDYTENNGYVIERPGSKPEYIDIFLIDYKKNEYYFVKDAFLISSDTHYNFGVLNISNYKSREYFRSSDYNSILKLKTTPKFQGFRLYSDLFMSIPGVSSLKVTRFDDCVEFCLGKNNSRSVAVNSQNISLISLGGESHVSYSKTNVDIGLQGYIDVQLKTRKNYSELYSYLYELALYIQLWKPDSLSINKLLVNIDGDYYETSFSNQYADKSQVEYAKSVSVDILDFLKNCYEKIPYRKGKREVRNIPYIVINTSRNVEDNFLMFYRFIECYYKQHGNEKKSSSFISDSISRYSTRYPNELDRLKVSEEIIKLRNHYVHSGYYIRNGSLPINPKDDKVKSIIGSYTVNSIDGHWIYNRAKVLYEVVINIIFKELLGYNDFSFRRIF